MTAMSCDFAVLGCGWAGAVAAMLLKERFPASSLLVLEAEEREGGLLRSENVSGFTFDVGGSHVMFSRNQATLEEMLTLLNGNYVKHERRTFIRLGERLVPYPLETGLYALPPEERADALIDLLEAWLSREPSWTPKTLEEWIRGFFGKWIAERYLIPYNEKVWKRPLSQISADWVYTPGRLPVPDWRDVARAAAGVRVVGYVEQSVFYYPLKGGIQALFDAALQRAGGRAIVVRGERVAEVRKSGGRWLINGKYSAKKVVSTIPLPELVNALDPPSDICKSAAGLDYNRVVVVGVGLKGRAPEQHWVYVPQKDVIFHRYAWVSNYSPCNAPQTRSALIAEVTVPRSVPVDKRELAERVVNDLEKLGVVRGEEVEVVGVWVHEYGYPVYRLDHNERREEVLRWLSELGLASVGRWGSWHYWNMDRVFEAVKATVSGV
jgi:protoporphyrinogen oxidase